METSAAAIFSVGGLDAIGQHDRDGEDDTPDDEADDGDGDDRPRERGGDADAEADDGDEESQIADSFGHVDLGRDARPADEHGIVDGVSGRLHIGDST